MKQHDDVGGEAVYARAKVATSQLPMSLSFLETQEK